jgi:hypothetical protein
MKHKRAAGVFAVIFLAVCMVTYAQSNECVDPGTRTVSGHVFHDLNKNGVLDSDEEGIPNAIISLKRFYNRIWPGGFTYNQTRTDTEGFFQLEITHNGVHLLEERDPDSVFTSTTLNGVLFFVATPLIGKNIEINFGDLKCKGHGEKPTTIYPAIDNSVQCCEGLKSRIQKDLYDEACTILSQGGSAYLGLCLSCGDSVCDSEYESKCNCPEDCK